MQGDGAPHRKQGEVKSQGSLEVGWRGGGGVGGGYRGALALRFPAPAESQLRLQQESGRGQWQSATGSWEL